MDDAEMHAADLIGIIVQQRHWHIREGRVDPQFLADFALHARIVSIEIKRKQPFISVVHMSADANRSLGDQPLFAGFFAANIMEDTIFVRQDDVGNDLLELAICLRSGARRKKIVCAIEQRRKIAIDLKGETLKAPS
jgi:hypothetical protein